MSYIKTKGKAICQNLDEDSEMNLPGKRNDNIKKEMGVCLGVWVFGCLGVWVFGCLGVWVFGCLGVWVYVCLVCYLFNR